MGIELYWDDDAQTVFLVTIEGAWLWDDLYAMLGKVAQICEKRAMELAAIIEFKGRLTLPGGSMVNGVALKNAHRLAKLGDNGTGQIIVVGIPPLLRDMFNLFFGLYPQALGNVRFASSLDQARALLAQAQPA